MMKTARVVILVALAVGAGCADASGHDEEHVGIASDVALPSRAGTVLVDSCSLDTWQRATLATPSAHRMLSEVVLHCLIPRQDGVVGPRDPSAIASLTSLVSDLKNDGYRVNLGIAFTDETGTSFSGAQTRAFIADPAWRRRFVDSLAPVIAPADGIEIDLEQLPNDATADVTALVSETAATVRPAKKLNVFVLPSVTTPSDIPGGDAVSRRALSPFVDRMRILTLDYAVDDPGPTIDPGWAVDAVRLARNDFVAVDISYPLYGTDFGPRGTRSVSYLEARAIAAEDRAPILRGPTGAPWVGYRAFGGESHEAWFDDAESTGRALGAWTFDVLPADVGVFFWGLGAEDPALFDSLAARMR